MCNIGQFSYGLHTNEVCIKNSISTYISEIHDIDTTMSHKCCPCEWSGSDRFGSV